MKNKKNRKHWYEQAADVVRKGAPDFDEPYDIVDGICEILTEYGFLDDDWWAENEMRQEMGR